MYLDYKKDWQEEFDRRVRQAGDYHSIIGKHPMMFMLKNRLLEAIENLPKDFLAGNVLDIGCGIGVHANIFHQLGFKNIYGVDLSPEMIKHAKSLSPLAINYQVADINSLPFPDKFSNVVSCLGIFQYLSREDQALALEEIDRVLKREGFLFFYALNKFSLKNLLLKENSNKNLIPTRISPFNFARLLKKKDYQVIGIRGIYTFPSHPQLLKFLYKCKFYDFLDRFFLLTNPLAHHFFIYARKKTSLP